jgi:hypothetical protein
MIAYVETAPIIELHGEHFLMSVDSGGDKVQFLLTARAFFMLKNYCAEAYAKRCIAEMEAREKVVKFSRKAKQGKR